MSNPTTAYTLTSTKGTISGVGALADAFRAALVLEAEQQPAHGVSIDIDDDTYEASSGRIAVESAVGDDDDEAGSVVLVDGELMIAWESGVRTPFSDRGLIPA